MGGFDSSDEENENTPVDTSPLVLNWQVGFVKTWLRCRPGSLFFTWLQVQRHLAQYEGRYSKGELGKYRAVDLLEQYVEAGITVHHHPFPDGQTPSTGTMLDILNELRASLNKGLKTLIHCYGGLGRSCLVIACLLLSSDDKLDPEQVIAKVKDFRGSGAVQSVKQYNFINDFRKNVTEFESSKAVATPELVS